jgi:hypothetical protein
MSKVGPWLHPIWGKSVKLWFMMDFDQVWVVHPTYLECSDVTWSKLLLSIARTPFRFSSFFVFSV